MKKSILCGLLAAALLALPARAARTVPVQVDGERLAGTAHLESGVTYVPLRYLLDRLGGWEIAWDSQNARAVASSCTHRLAADPAANTVTVNGQAYSGKVYVENGRTYVPLRLVCNLLGGSAVWDPYLGGAAVTSPGADHDAVDLYWLSRIISAESRGEPLTGQMAVGNVVLNRVSSREFPDTIPGVIFDRVDGVQFEPVSNGTIYQAPAPQSVEAAKRVLDGEVVLQDALYFYAPALSQGVWINANRTYHSTIGCHRFYL
ncbi:cell wall hydrolase [Dysosmobacter sp.]|uniref:cell wall hydrolase n=1 Tax=Dysosmobacter sp. TaxID=2591382 RepID=UPI002A84F3B6|nr:cell wall hydrolase [Dysosmobacter sp.]MDY3984811.1 cell wall hydrolase [Dysosmobacter sp.]